MTRPEAVRLGVALVPLVAACLLALTLRPSRRLWAGVLLASAWNVWALLALNIVAVHFGWWIFDPRLPSFMGVSSDAWLGWVLLWGVVVPLASHGRSVTATLVAVAWLDLVAMPQLAPLVVLRSGWLVGEVLALIAVLLPSLLLARWTARDTRLEFRAALQVVCAAGLFLWFVPTMALSRNGGWAAILELPSWRSTLAAQILVLPIAMGVRAVIEFVRHGRGTPLPYDPPVQLVVTGPYTYVRNPMQLSVVSMLAFGGVLFADAWVTFAAVIGFAFSAGLAEWHENEQLTERFGRSWVQYRQLVRAWFPSWKPQVIAEATLLVAFSCETCSSIGRWFVERGPTGLRVAPAERSADPGIRRITYIAGNGRSSQGVGAVARALEHIHLGWAMIGWVLLLPGMVQIAQLIADVFGPAPQRVAGLPYDERACAVKKGSAFGAACSATETHGN